MACITDTDSIDLNVSNGQLSGTVKISGDAHNLLELAADGLLVSGLNAFPSGMIVPYGGDAAPTGWLLCDGSAVNRSTYANLFAAIGTKFGIGDGSTTFNLPDTRGRVLPGVAPAGGHVDMATIGLNDGTAVLNRRPKHQHTPHSHIVGRENVSLQGGATPYSIRGNSSILDSSSQPADGGSGVGSDPLDGPAYVVVNYLVKI